MAIKLLQQRTKNLKYVQSCAQGRIKTVGGHNLCVCVGGGATPTPFCSTATRWPIAIRRGSGLGIS